MKTIFGYKEKIIERESEIKKLSQYLDPITNNKFGGVVYIEGKAGIGKTRLVTELQQNYKNKEELNWIFLSCDIARRVSFNPFTAFLNEFFDQSPENQGETNKSNFEDKLHSLYGEIENEKIKYEIIRTRSFLGALLDLHWKNSLYEELEPKNRYENILSALQNFFYALSLIKPTVIVLDDSNWIDNDTVKFLKLLCINAEDFPFILLILCRQNEDASPFALNFENDIPLHRMIIEPLSREESRKLIDYYLNLDLDEKKELPDKTVDLIHEKARGNTLILKQVVDFIKSREIIDNDLIIVDRFEIPDNIDELINAKFESMHPDLKEVTKMASVLGKNFTIKVLGEMLKNRNIDKYIHEGKRKNIWHSLSKVNQSFENESVYKAIYNKVLTNESTKYHKLAAKSIEKVYEGNLQSHYSELAYNFEMADVESKAVFYLGKAAEKAREMYENQAALDYYTKLHHILENSAAKNENILLDILLQKIDLFILLGNTREAETKLSGIDLTRIDQKEIIDKFYYLQAKLYATIQNYLELEKYVISSLGKVKTKVYKFHLEIFYIHALWFLNKYRELEDRAKFLFEVFRKENEKLFEAKLANSMANYYLRKSQYENAMKFFRRHYKIVAEQKDKILIQIALRQIGVVYFRQGHRQKARKFYEESLKLAENIGNKNECSKLNSDIASVLATDGEVKEAIFFYKKGLELARSVANKVQEGLILYNIGESYFRLEDHQTSMEYLEASKKICRQISDNVGITYANDLHGDILMSLKRFEEAKTIYQENLILQQETDDQEGIAHTLGNLGRVAEKEKDLTGAEKLYKKQQQTLAVIGDKEGEGKALFNWGMMEKDRNNLERAKEKLEKALKLFTECSYKSGEKLAKLQLEMIDEESPARENN